MKEEVNGSTIRNRVKKVSFRQGLSLVAGKDSHGNISNLPFIALVVGEMSTVIFLKRPQTM
jgi:hypothetical protein